MSLAQFLRVVFRVQLVAGQGGVELAQPPNALSVVGRGNVGLLAFAKPDQ